MIFWKWLAEQGISEEEYNDMSTADQNSLLWDYGWDCDSEDEIEL